MTDLRTIPDDELEALRTARLPVDAPHDVFMAALITRNEAGLEYGRRQGWWQDYQHDPLPPRKTVKASDYASKTMAHVMVDAGFFGSVSDARRNGWNKPVTKGLHAVGKTKIVEVVD
jgi:hypothetical protein